MISSCCWHVQSKVGVPWQASQRDKREGHPGWQDRQVGEVTTMTRTMQNTTQRKGPAPHHVILLHDNLVPATWSGHLGGGGGLSCVTRTTRTWLHMVVPAYGRARPKDQETVKCGTLPRCVTMPQNFYVHASNVNFSPGDDSNYSKMDGGTIPCARSCRICHLRFFLFLSDGMTKLFGPETLCCLWNKRTVLIVCSRQKSARA